MIKVFIPQDKAQGKTKARGFWYSKDTNKIYYDYLKVLPLRFIYGQGQNNSYASKELQFLKHWHKQEALFFISGHYKEQGKGFIFYEQDKIEVLPNRIYKEVLRVNLKVEIKEALRLYKGVTVYKEGNRYFKEIFYK